MPYKIDYKKNLNEEQYSAVMHHEGPCLVIAGAGTGKTTTLVYRVARLIEDGVRPESILVLTFTRKAAENVNIRSSKMLDERCQLINAYTFHGFSLAELKHYVAYTGYSPKFTVLLPQKAGEILNLVKEELNIRALPYKFPPNKEILAIRSKMTTKLLSLDDAIAAYYPLLKDYRPLIGLLLEKYQAFKKERNEMDFDDLLGNFRKLLSENDFIRETLSKKYRFIMIDEYQDTDRIQAEIVKLVAGSGGNIMAVGDDAQSIYAFRGADFRNIMSFPQLFQDTRVITIARNYRSTRGILALGNAIMTNARERYEKKLYTDKPGDNKPSLIRVRDGYQQSLFVAETIEYLQSRGSRLKDMAVLFRNSYFSSDLETVLHQRRLPFKKFGGKELKSKPHIQDVMALLRVGMDNGDVLGWYKILSLFRGIGPKKAAKVTAIILKDARGIEHLREISLSGLYHLVMSLSLDHECLEKQIKRIAEFYWPIFLSKNPHKRKEWRDIEALVAIASNFTSPSDFINDLAMKNLDEENIGEKAGGDYLTLSTIHSAKGLEWDIVFIIYANDGCMPCVRNNRSQAEIDEEVRIFHVAVTRAKNHLYLVAPWLPTFKESTGRVSPFLTDQIIEDTLEVKNDSTAETGEFDEKESRQRSFPLREL